MSNREMTNRHQEDEASVVGAWRVLIKHKKMVFFIWILISLGGVIATMVMPETYAFTTLVKVGERAKDDLVEPVSAVRNNLVSFIIYGVQRKFLDEGGYDIDVNVSVKNRSMFLLESNGTAQSAQDHFALHGAVLEALIQHQEELKLKKHRESYAVRWELGQRRLADFKGSRASLAERLKHLDEANASLKPQAFESDVTSAFMQAIFFNMRQNMKTDIANLSLLIDVERAALSGTAISSLEIKKTKAATPFAQSKNPVAPHRRLIIMLAIFSGLIMAMLGAFLIESFLKAREGAEHP